MKTQYINNDINAKIERHFGEFVLLISAEEEFFGCTGFGYKPRNEDYRIKETIFIGVITGRKLVKVGKSWAIPTERYVEWDTLGTNLEISEGKILSFSNNHNQSKLEKVLRMRKQITLQI
jgi:hypothetical protein